MLRKEIMVVLSEGGGECIGNPYENMKISIVCLNLVQFT